MIEKKAACIRIVKHYFGKKNAIVSLIFVSILSLTGIISVFTNWKSGLCAAGAVIFIYFFQKVFGYKYLLLGIAAIVAAIYWLGQVLNIEFAFFALTLVFLPFIFFVKPCYDEYKKSSDFEVFYLDKRKIKCVVTLDGSDYKGYMLNPKSYVKEFPSVKIKAFSFAEKNMMVAVGDLLIRPKELSHEDLFLIQEYVHQYFPDLLQNREVIRENNKKENLFYLHKLMIFSPIFILGIGIYLFADNGKDQLLTYTLLILMVALPAIIYSILRKIKK